MKKLILLIVIFTAGFLNVNSTNFYVSNSGNNSNTGLSPGSAFLTIQFATNIVVAGDCVLVANGNYVGFNHQSLNSGTSGSPIVYKAIGSSVNITTHSSHVYNGINVENNDYIHIIGFKVCNMYVLGNSNSNGVRMVLADHCVIRNCLLDSNYRGILTGHSEYLLIENNICNRNLKEHGIYVSNNADYAIVRNNTCIGNVGAGIQFNPDYSSQYEPNDGICDWAVITGNVLGKNGTGLNTQGLSNTIIANNLIYDNNNHGISFYQDYPDSTSAAGVPFSANNVDVYNNTIVGNTAGRWQIFMSWKIQNVKLYNNVIVKFSSAFSGGSFCYYDGQPYNKNFISDYNIVCNKFCETDDGCADPYTTWKADGHDVNSIMVTSLTGLFVDPANGDFHLANGSAAIDAGTSLVSADVTKDLEKMVRPAGLGYDIGCYESGSVLSGIRKLKTTNSKVEFTDNSVKVNTENEKDLVTFYDILGNVMQNGKTWDHTNNVNGIYMYSITNITTGERYTSKFLVNHK